MASLSIGGAPRIWGLVDLLGIKSLHFHKSPLYNSHSFAPSAVSFGEGMWCLWRRQLGPLSYGICGCASNFLGSVTF